MEVGEGQYTPTRTSGLSIALARFPGETGISRLWLGGSWNLPTRMSAPSTAKAEGKKRPKDRQGAAQVGPEEGHEDGRRVLALIL